ncbi:MAG: hypothetical protein KDD50_02910 [Bdellovibrionales bacterium]|nr:hypothetical protein [Bdellovibrionales bacterium]
MKFIQSAAVFSTVLLLTVNSYAGGIEDALQDAGSSIKKEFNNLRVQTDLDLFDLDIIDGIGTGLKYKIEIEPSFFDEHYTRIESFRLNADVNHGEKIGELGEVPINISFGLRNNTEMIFARQFKSQREAFADGVVSYTIKNIPLTAQRAIEKLQPGDFYATKADMSFIVGAGVSQMKGIVQLSAATHFLITGQFQVHIYRAKDNRVRFRAFAIKSKSKGASVGARTLPDFEVFGLKLLDRQIVRMFKVDLARLSVSKGNSTVFMVDYMFNFSDQNTSSPVSLGQTKKAYDQVIQNSFKFKPLNSNAWESLTSDREKIRELGLTLIEPVEKIVDAERSQSIEDSEKRVHRYFLGFTETKSHVRDFKYGTILTRFKNSKSFSHTRLRSRDENNQPKDYVISAYTGRKTSEKDSIISKLLGFLDFLSFKMEEIQSAAVVTTADQRGNPQELSDFVLRYDMRDRIFRDKELKRFENRLKRILPEDKYKEVITEIYRESRPDEEGKPWDKKFDGKTLKKVRVAYQVSFKRPALLLLENLSGDQITDYLEKYLETIPKPSALLPTGLSDHQHRRSNEMWNFLRKTQLIRGLEEAFDTSRKNSDRLESFEDLRDNALFKQIAGGFIVYLLENRMEPGQTFEEFIHFSLDMTAKGLRTIDMQFGQDFDAKLYNALMYQQSIINNREFDLRLIECNQSDARDESCI